MPHNYTKKSAKSAITLMGMSYGMPKGGGPSLRDGHSDPILHGQTYPETLWGTMVSVTRVLHHALRIRRV